MDPSKEMRLTAAIDQSMDVFIVSQALAEGQLRKSGVNFFNEGGILGNTGRNLEKFLNQFNRTVYPPRKVSLASGAMVRQATSSFRSVYNTELTQCFPGKTGKGEDRVPSSTEITTCLGRNFLKREIALMMPTLLLLMGDKSRKAFYKYITAMPRKDTLQAHLDNIIASGSIPMHKIGEVSVSVLPIQHASGANPAFNGMLKNEQLITLIRDFLEQS
jgi:uracil-DNA glycosylase